MMKKRSFNKQIADEATAWVVALDDGPPQTDERRELIEWLRASPAHVEAFLTAASIFEGVAHADPQAQVNIEALIAEASADIVTISGAPDAIPTTSAPAVDSAPAPRNKFRARLWPSGAIAASLALVVSVTTFFLLFSPLERGPEPLVVATALGELRSVTLEDGSIVYVNTQSHIEVLYSETERRIDLKQGEALFEVEKDPTRPFKVIAGDTVAEALGTTFNVRLIDNEAEVSVVEETVAFGKTGLAFDLVEQEDSLPGSDETTEQQRHTGSGHVILTAGEKADIGPTAQAPRVEKTDIAAISAWRVRKLMFDEDDLETIVRDFNRYNRRRLVIVSPSLEAERFSGIFAADDPESFVEFLELTSAIEGVEVGSEIRLHEAR